MERLLCILSGMNVGGAETFLMKVYRSIDRSEYQMDFCINEKNKCAYEDEIISMGGRVFRIVAKSVNRPLFEKQLFEVVRNNQYKNVLRITSNCAGFLDLKIAKKAGAIHTIARSSNASDGGGLKARATHLLGRLLWEKYVDVKIAPSDLAAIYTFGKRTYEKGEVNILRNALDLTLFHFSQEERNRIRAEFGISQQTVLVGHIGRFMEQKNHFFLLDVFCEFHKNTPDSLLMLVGGHGNLEDAVRQGVIEKKIAGSVIFTGIRSDIPALLSAMDVMVMPSLYEGMPNSIIEAQAAGLPCVISESITKEADVTGLVRYLSLSAPIAVWSDEIKQVCDGNRESKTELLKAAGYDIIQVKQQFQKLLFLDKEGNQR